MIIINIISSSTALLSSCVRAFVPRAVDELVLQSGTTSSGLLVRQNTYKNLVGGFEPFSHERLSSPGPAMSMRPFFVCLSVSRAVDCMCVGIKRSHALRVINFPRGILCCRAKHIRTRHCVLVRCRSLGAQNSWPASYTSFFLNSHDVHIMYVHCTYVQFP